MKLKTLIILFTFISLSLNAQNAISNNKYIDVTGSAELEIQPDELELKFTLAEYMEGNTKIKLDIIETKFSEILKKNNIDYKEVTLGDSDSYYWWYWWTYYRNPISSKSVNIKISNKTDFLKLVKDLNQKWMQSIQIVKSSNKDVQKYRKDVKKEAVKAAKEKAQYLLETLDEEIGGVILIEEIQEKDNYWNSNRNSISNVVVASNNDDEAIKNVSKIKLRYEINVRFAIK